MLDKPILVKHRFGSALTHVCIDCLDRKVHVDELQVLAESMETSVALFLEVLTDSLTY